MPDKKKERQAVKKPERVAAKNTKRTSYPVRMLRWAASRRSRESRRPNEAKSTTQNKRMLARGSHSMAWADSV